MKKVTAKSIVGVCCALLLGTVVLMIFVSSEKGQKESKKVVEMQLLYAEEKLESYPEFPQTEYPGGVKVYYEDQSEDVPCAEDVKYTSDDPSVFVVLDNGSICPTGVGTANLTAEYGGMTVTRAFRIGKGTIVSIEPAQTQIVLQAGKVDAISIPVYAYGSNGYCFEIEDTSQISVKKGNEVLNNHLTSDKFSSNGITAFEVTAYNQSAPVEVVSVDPNTAPISASTSKLLLTINEKTIVNVYAEIDGQQVDISHLVSWNSSNEEVVVATDEFVSANECGSAELTASFGDQSITIPVEVTEPPSQL